MPVSNRGCGTARFAIAAIGGAIRADMAGRPSPERAIPGNRLASSNSKAPSTGLRFEKFPQFARQQRAGFFAQHLFVLLPQHAEINDGQADGGQRDREQPAVLENVPCQVAEIETGAERAEDDEYPPDDHDARGNHQNIDAKIDELRDFAVGFLRGHSAPEGDHAEQVEPEGVIGPVRRSEIHPERDQDHRQAEIHRDQRAELEIPLVAHEHDRHVHRHVPEGGRDRHDQERIAVAPGDDQPDDQRAELHVQPVPLDVLVIFAVDALVRPQSERLLQSVDGQRRQRDDEGGADAGGNRVALLPECAGQFQADAGIGQRDEEDSPAAERLPAEIHEQRHRADRDQAAQVVEHVGEIEGRADARQAGQIIVQSGRLLGGDDVLADGVVKIFPGNFHWWRNLKSWIRRHRAAATVSCSNNLPRSLPSRMFGYARSPRSLVIAGAAAGKARKGAPAPGPAVRTPARPCRRDPGGE